MPSFNDMFKILGLLGSPDVNYPLLALIGTGVATAGIWAIGTYSRHKGLEELRETAAENFPGRSFRDFCWDRLPDPLKQFYDDLYLQKSVNGALMDVQIANFEPCMAVRQLNTGKMLSIIDYINVLHKKGEVNEMWNAFKEASHMMVAELPAGTNNSTAMVIASCVATTKLVNLYATYTGSGPILTWIGNAINYQQVNLNVYFTANYGVTYNPNFISGVATIYSNVYGQPTQFNNTVLMRIIADIQSQRFDIVDTETIKWYADYLRYPKKLYSINEPVIEYSPLERYANILKKHPFDRDLRNRIMELDRNWHLALQFGGGRSRR
jgi:hypothetical protein